MSEEFVFINDQIVTKKDAKISIEQRGFKFGDGLFETIKLQNSEVQNWPLHLARLTEGLKQIKINFSTDLLPKIAELIGKNNITDGFIRLSISRGEGSIGYLPKDDIKPLLVIEVLPSREIDKSPRRLVVSSYKRASTDIFPAGFKTMQAMPSSLALIEAKEKGYDDALMLNEKNEICETTSANIFFKINEKLITPHKNTGIVAGVSRETYLLSNKAIEGIVRLEDLKNVTEIFLTNIACDQIPIAEIYTQNGELIFKAS